MAHPVAGRLERLGAEGAAALVLRPGRAGRAEAVGGGIADAPEPDGIVFIIAGKGAGRRGYNHILSPMYQGRKRQVRGRMQNCDKNIFILSLYIMINEQRPFVNKIWDFSFFDLFKGKYRNGFPWPANCGNQFLPLWH